MRIIPLEAKFCSDDTRDWCHLCGERKTKFVVFTVPKNAEWSTEDACRGYFRFCDSCVTRLSVAMQLKLPESGQDAPEKLSEKFQITCAALQRCLDLMNAIPVVEFRDSRVARICYRTLKDVGVAPLQGSGKT